MGSLREDAIGVRPQSGGLSGMPEFGGNPRLSQFLIESTCYN